jgi:hypothetical protein
LIIVLLNQLVYTCKQIFSSYRKEYHFLFLFSLSKNRSLFPIEYLSIPEKTLRAGATQATADLDNDLVAG